MPTPQDLWTAVDRYICDSLVPTDDALDAALACSAAAGLPSIQVAPNQGKLLHLLARILNASSVLELGTLGGYSTIWLGRALAPGGRLVTVESDPKHADVARANIARAGLGGVVEVRVGNAADELPRIALDAGRPFDLVFIDADKAGIPVYFTWALRLTRPGGVIVVDNVIRDGRVIDGTSDDPGVRGVRRFNEMLAAERRVSASAVQTVGSKGHDGFALALVLAPA